MTDECQLGPRQATWRGAEEGGMAEAGGGKLG